jgi:hypothetical protein
VSPEVHTADTPGPIAGAAAAVVELPGLGWWANTSVSSLTSGELVDGVVAADRLLSRVHAEQAALMSELARPGRAGDITDLVEALTCKAGKAMGPDGTVDVEAFDGLVTEQAHRMAAAVVGAALHISPVTARCRVNQATELVHHLPATFQALRHGRIDRTRARIIADRTSALESGARRDVEDQLVDLAATRSPRGSGNWPTGQ